ncbi:hypothetical protein IscW_ISCW017129 [Ixodes scapularis]|uniref:lysozyme n=1 Tax=Ixodes scapularis TaxID=6945 RepID=B7PA89_IXOSC|nr:hypothetical protein IscW_ISCW017129 [Ixodes scapularis]|eukprot:XP_002406658.1 hypothetical protein IscW_ISCW017129 [Ixodes scapularis]
MIVYLLLSVSCVLLPCSWGKVFDKCELARELVQVHGIPKEQVGNYLEDDDLTDDIECVRLIYERHGFRAWTVWGSVCRNINYSTYLSDCGYVQPRSSYFYTYFNPLKK